MSLNYMVETLDGIDEGIKPLYEQSENGFILKVSGLEDTSGLKSALTKERELNKEYKAKAKASDEATRQANEAKLAEEGKYKELFESKQNEATETTNKFNELQIKIAKAQGNSLIKDLALNMTTDKDEIEIISRFADDYLIFDGEEAKFNKPIEDIKATLVRFVKSKATGGNDSGNNKGDGKSVTMNRSEFSQQSPEAQSKFMRSGGMITD